MAAVGERRGRSPERVYVTPPAEVLHCAVCLDVLSAPVSLPACGHTYCRACVATISAKSAAQRKCPTCRSDISRGVVAAALPLNWVVKATVDALRVRCRFGVKEEGGGWMANEAGCPAQLTLDGAAAHEAACGFATITCPFAGCGVELRRSDVASHNAASVQAHLEGERAARLASDARLAACETRLTACETTSASRFAALEASHAALEARFSSLAQPAPLPHEWVARSTISIADREGTGLRIHCCAFSSSSNEVCVALGDFTLKLFDIATGDHRLTLEGHEAGVNCCAFSPDGSTIVSASGDNTLKLWNAASGVNFCTLDGHTTPVLCWAFRFDGRSICSGSWDNPLKLWDVATGVCHVRLDGHADWVRCCAYSPDGATVLSGSDDGMLKLWSVATGACIRTFTGHTNWVSACYFSSADGNTILSGSCDDTLKLWDATTGVCHRMLTMCCAFGPDGATIASGDDVGQLKLWRHASHRRGSLPPCVRPTAVLRPIF